MYKISLTFQIFVHKPCQNMASPNQILEGMNFGKVIPSSAAENGIVFVANWHEVQTYVLPTSSEVILGDATKRIELLTLVLLKKETASFGNRSWENIKL